MITNLDLIKQIAIKDFDHFVDHRTFVSEEVDPMVAKNLFSLEGMYLLFYNIETFSLNAFLTGQRWKNMRSTLSPTFTGSKMRILFKLISEMGQQLNNHLTKKVDSEKVVTMEVKDLFTRFANDVIATSAFGIKCDSLEERDNEFYHMGLSTILDGFVDNLKFFGYTLSPSIMNFLSVKLFNSTAASFFRDIILSTIKIREEQGIIRQDMLQLLIEARNSCLEQRNSNKGNMNEIQTHGNITV